MIDIVFPSNNEEEFIAMASKLGYDSLVFVYDKKKEIKIKTNLKIYQGIISTTNIKQKKKTSNLVIYKGNDVRNVIEKQIPDLMFELETSKRADFMHHRNSGLNHVLCKLAAKNKVIIGLSFSSILKANPLFRSVILGRISQNIRLCQKYKVNLAVASFALTPYEMAAPNDLISLFVSLGGMQNIGKKALNVVEEKIKENIKKKGADYIGEGIEKV